MAETFCGKVCDECTWREPLNCSGCKAGPGWLYGGDCELAKCCRGKGHEACATCGFSGSCSMLQSRDQQPVYRKKRRDAAERKKAALKSRAQILGKWLWILFWLDMASTFAELLKNQYVFRITPLFYPAGLILTTACSIACGVILLKLSSVEYRYRTAGICALIVAAAQFLEIFSDKITDGQIIWALFIALPAPIIGMVGTYNEFHAHAAVLTGVSSTLSEKWLVLWKWCLGCTLAMVGSILTFIPFFSTVLLLIASIGVLVVGVVQLVYLYRTAKTFQEYAAK